MAFVAPALVDALSDLTRDVQLSTLAAGDLLAYNAGSSRWVNFPVGGAPNGRVLGISSGVPAWTGSAVLSDLAVSGLTTPRIPYASTGGLLADDGALRWNNTNKTLLLGPPTTNNNLITLTGESGATLGIGYDAINILSWGKGVTANSSQLFYTRSGAASGVFSLHHTTYAAQAQPQLTTMIGLVVKGFASQSANLTEWQDSNAVVTARVNAAGEFSNPNPVGGSGAGNERFGAGALASVVSAANCTAFGFHALQFNTASGNTAFGYNAGSGASLTGNNNTFMGLGAGAACQGGNANVALGYSAGGGLTSGIKNVLLGGESGISSNGDNNTAVGFRSLQQGTSGSQNVCVGERSGEGLTIGSQNVFVGYVAHPLTNSIGSSIAIGTQATVTANNQFVAGSNTNAINDVYFGNGVTQTSPATWTLNGSGASGTDVAGADLNIAGGKGTGTGAGGAVTIRVCPATTTGSTLNPLVTAVTFSAVTQNVLLQTSALGMVGLVVRGTSGQTANLTEWRDSNSVVGARVNAAGEFSNPNPFGASGADNERFGVGALRQVTSGGFNTAFGKAALSATTNTSNNTAVGSSAMAAGIGTNSVAVGVNALLNSAGSDNVVISPLNGLVNLTSGSGNILIGGNPSVSTLTVGANNTLIGVNVDVLTNSTSNSVAIGRSSKSESNSFVCGSPFLGLSNVYFGSGVTDTGPLVYTINGTGGSGTDVNGAAVRIAGGKATGAAVGGNVEFQTSNAGSSGATLQSLTTKVKLTAKGSFVLAPAALATNTTDGFTYLPTCAGTPSGVPTTQTGTVATLYDTTANKLWVYNGSWRSVTLA